MAEVEVHVVLDKICEHSTDTVFKFDGKWYPFCEVDQGEYAGIAEEIVFKTRPYVAYSYDAVKERGLEDLEVVETILLKFKEEVMEDNTANFSVTKPDQKGFFFVVFEDRWYGFNAIIFSSPLGITVEDLCKSILSADGPDYNWVSKERVVQELGEDCTKVEFVVEVNKETGEVSKGLMQ